MPNQPRAKPKPPPDPQARAKHPGMANLKQPWPKGVSGNPSGKSRNLNEIMRQARSHAPECIDRLLEIIRDKDASHRDVIAACCAMLDRGCGRPIAPVFQGAHGLPAEMIGESGADGEITALISAAKGDGAYRKALVEELARIDAEARAEKAGRRDQIAAARAAQMNGAPVDPAMQLLLKTKDETD